MKSKRVVMVALLLVLIVGVAATFLYKSGLWGFFLYDQRQEGTLRVGDLAPDFKLVAADGKSEIRLRDLLGRKPVVLTFGSYT